MHSIKRFFVFLLSAYLLPVFSYGQCGVSIINLPDTVKICNNAQVQLSPSLSLTGSPTMLDTFWTPTTGLSNPNILNPIAALGSSPVMYTLTVKSLSASNLVSNGDFSGGNTGFTSDYIDTFGSGVTLPEGYYSIQTNPNSIHPGFASFGDHTNGTGNMMVLNGAPSSVNVWCQTISVVPNTDYDFSAWGASCFGSNPAQLQFVINGILQGTPLTLPTTSGIWTQFHIVWNSGSSSSAQICIYDVQTIAGGNDFAIDDIAFRPICKALDSVYIIPSNISNGISKTMKYGCIVDTVYFSALDSAGSSNFYAWTFGDGGTDTIKSPIHAYTTQGVYTVILKSSSTSGCMDSSTTTVDTRHSLSASITADKDSVCTNQTVQFSSSDNGTLTPLGYYWEFGDGGTNYTSGTSHTFTSAGVYNVIHIANDQVPCYDTATVTIVVVDVPPLTLTLDDDLLCIGEPATLHAIIYPGYDTIRWTFSDGAAAYQIFPDIKHTFKKAGSYDITLNISYTACPDVTAVKNVTVADYPHVNIGKDTSICPNENPYTLYNLYSTTENYLNLWSTGQTQPSIETNQPGTYWLYVTNWAGCSAADTMEIARSCYFDVPNAFSPNGDGVNEYFFPRQLLSKKLLKFHMDIYNRWGEKIFVTDNVDGRGWDGRYNDRLQEEGVYIYLITAQVFGQDEIRLKGNVTLLK